MGGIASGLANFGKGVLNWAGGMGIGQNSPAQVANRGNMQNQQIKQQQADQLEQERLMAQQKQELELHQHLMTLGARPVVNGMTKDENVPLPPHLAALGLPNADGTPGPTIPQTVSIARPVDKSRLVKFKDHTGQEAAYELPTPEEQAARQVKLAYPAQQAEAAQAGNVAQATAAGTQAGMQQAREANGIAVPQGSGPASGMKVLPNELPGIVQGSVIAQEAGSKIRKAKLAMASQQLGAVTSPLSYRQAYSQLDPDVQQYFDAPENFDKIQSPTRARMLNMTPEEQQKTSLMTRMAPEEWDAQVDNVVPVSSDPKAAKDTQALNNRTKALVRQSVSRGDFAGAEKAIKDASDQLGRTETAVRTARETAPIKIDVAGRETAARTPQISDSGLDLMAENLLSGKPISMRNPVLYAKATNRAAELAKERGLDSQATVMATTAARVAQQNLQSVSKQYELMKPFAAMAEKNADILEKQIAQVSDLGAPILNTPLRNIEQKFGGNTKVTALKAALLPVQADFARILSSPSGAGTLTDESKREMQSAIEPGATPGMIKAALDIYRADAENRKQSYEKDIADLKQLTVVRGNQPAPATAPQGAAPALAPTHKLNGKPIAYDIGKKTWVYTDTGQEAK